MPRLSSETKEQIKGLPKEKLEEVVLKMAAKDKSFFDHFSIFFRLITLTNQEAKMNYLKVQKQIWTKYLLNHIKAMQSN